MTEIEIFRKFDQIRNFFKIFDRNRNSRKISQNRNFYENLTKIDFFSKFSPILSKIAIFSKI